MKAFGHGLFKVVQWLACYVIFAVVGFASAVVLCGITLHIVNAVESQFKKTERRMQYEYELSH